MGLAKTRFVGSRNLKPRQLSALSLVRDRRCVRAGMADSWVGSFGGVGDWGSKMYEDAKVA